jgi:hypothetical protein
VEYSAKFWDRHLQQSTICDDDNSAIAPLAFNLSDPSAELYRMWSHIRWGIYFPTSSSRLIVACNFGHVAVVKQSLENGADVNAHTERYETALQVASLHNFKQIVKLLINKGAEVNAKSEPYGNALRAAAFNGHEQIAEILINEGADIDANDEEHGSALQAAASRGHEKVVNLLLNKGADVNAQGGLYDTVIHAASFGGYQQIVNLLLNEGADINANDKAYKDALRAASARAGYEGALNQYSWWLNSVYPPWTKGDWVRNTNAYLMYSFPRCTRGVCADISLA